MKIKLNNLNNCYTQEASQKIARQMYFQFKSFSFARRENFKLWGLPPKIVKSFHCGDTSIFTQGRGKGERKDKIFLGIF